MKNFRIVLASAFVLLFAQVALPQSLSTTTLNVEGMTCGSCATAVKLVLEDTTGVVAAKVSYERKEAVVTYDARQTNPQKIAEAVRAKLPYSVTPAETKRTATTTPAQPAPPLAAYRTEELRTAFNSAQDAVRVVALLSPTCGACQHGQRTVESVFTKFPADRRLQGFVVWLPMLKNDDASSAALQARTFTDARVLQRWDGSRKSGDLFATTLKLNRTAWDIYLVYAPGVTWTGESAPQPTFWMHQLRADSGADQKACLNPAALIAKVRELLARKA